MRMPSLAWLRRTGKSDENANANLHRIAAQCLKQQTVNGSQFLAAYSAISSMTCAF